MKILTIVGARPQFVKAAALSRALAEHSVVEEVLVHTGQHFDKNMSDVFFEEMRIPKPVHNLEINSLGHGAMTGRMLEAIEKLVLSEKPNIVLVYGDTNSTLAGALAARKLHVAVAHVEAGLRSFNMAMPEEINRILTDRISDHLFCPTTAAMANLHREGFEHFPCKLYRTGDVMQDAAHYYAQFSAEHSRLLNQLGGPKGFALVTIHRAENTDNPLKLRALVEALNALAGRVEVICPLHPRTAKMLSASGLKLAFRVIEPVGYFDMIELLKASAVVVTDSGGVQKEAFFFKRPCLTLRDQTEWVELVENGFNRLVDPAKESLTEAFEQVMKTELNFDVDLYGKGRASQQIAGILAGLA